jgi:hypothetical protein
VHRLRRRHVQPVSCAVAGYPTHHGDRCTKIDDAVDRSMADHGDGQWGRDAIDLIEPGFIEFAGDGAGKIGFIALRGRLDCRPVERDGCVGVEFTWDGVDEGDQVSGRGWASLVDDARIVGHLFFHMGDDSSFRARR